jgi:hypothetical protein
LNVSHDVAAFARRAAQAVTESTNIPPLRAAERPSNRPAAAPGQRGAHLGFGSMSLRELERRARQRRAALSARLPPDDDAVLTFREWCALNGFSPRTGRRILKAPGGPVVTQLSPMRIGITRGNNRRWQASKARG